MYYDDMLTIAFIFKDKGATLSDVKVIRPGRNGKAKAMLLIQLNKLNIESEDHKFRMVDVRFGDYIKRKQLDTYIGAIQRYYKERYAKKRYDSKKHWFQSDGVRRLLKQEEEQFVSDMNEYRRELIIDSLID